MGVKKKPTLKILFRQFAISLIVMLVAAIIVPFGLEGLAINAGLATRANLSELQVKEIIPTLTIAPDITKVVIPQGCGYLILDKNFNELYSNMDDDEKEIALLYAKGEYIEYATGRQFALVVRENEFCVLRYYIGSQFTVSWLPEYFPSPDTLAFILMAVNSLLVIIILTARFAKNLRTQLTPLFEATAEVSKQNLDFEVGHAKIKEFEDVLASFSDMKDNLKISLERQWKTEQTQKEQIAALAHDLKTPLTVIQGNADLLTETNLDDEQRLYAGYVVESSGQMQSYIQTLIDISRAAVGYQLHIESIDLPAFMQHLFGYMESLCRTKEIRLQMNTVSLPQMLKFDRVLIERAIMNVISNGLDYSPQGGTLYVDVQSNNGFVEISVTDEGTGFSKEALCHAQERFYMGDQSRNSKLHFGIGLYITNSIMEQHNGQLILENSKDTTKLTQSALSRSVDNMTDQLDTTLAAMETISEQVQKQLDTAQNKITNDTQGASDALSAALDSLNSLLEQNHKLDDLLNKLDDLEYIDHNIIAQIRGQLEAIATLQDLAKNLIDQTSSIVKRNTGNCRRKGRGAAFPVILLP